MVHAQQQHRASVRAAQPGCAHHRPCGGVGLVDDLPRGNRYRAVDLTNDIGGCDHAGFAGHQPGAVGGVHQNRTQRLMPIEQQLKHQLDRRAFDVVGQPDQHAVAEAAVVAVLEQPGHHRQRQHLAVADVLDRASLGGRVDGRGEAANRGRREDHTWADREASRTRLVHQGDRDDAVHPDLEEIAVDIGDGAIELLCEDLAQRSLGVGPRLGGAVPHIQRFESHTLQDRAVQLAVSVHRQPRQRDDARRNHVRGKLFGQGGPHPGRVAVGTPDYGADQADPTRTRHNAHRRVQHLGPAAHRGLDLTDLNPVAADLHLGVAAAHVGVPAVGQLSHEITGAVHALAGPKRVGDEAFGRHARPAQVAASQLCTGQIQLSDHTGGHFAQRRIQHVTGCSGVRRPDRGSPVLSDWGHHRFDRRLGGPIAVVDRGR